MATCTHNSDCLVQDLLPVWSLVLITLIVWGRTCCQYGHVYSELWLFGVGTCCQYGHLYSLLWRFGAGPAANMVTCTQNSDCLVQDLLPIWPRGLITLTVWCRTCCQYGHVYSELWLQWGQVLLQLQGVGKMRHSKVSRYNQTKYFYTEELRAYFTYR